MGRKIEVLEERGREQNRFRIHIIAGILRFVRFLGALRS